MMHIKEYFFTSKKPRGTIMGLRLNSKKAKKYGCLLQSQSFCE